MVRHVVAAGGLLASGLKLRLRNINFLLLGKKLGKGAKVMDICAEKGSVE